MAIRCCHCNGRHDTVDEVRECSGTGTTPPEHHKPEADLVAWLSEQTWSDFAQSLHDFYWDRGYLTTKQIAAAESMHNKIEEREREKERAYHELPDPPQGIHIVHTHDETAIYKVQVAVHGSGRKYAKLLDEQTGRFIMAPGAIRFLSEHTLMSLEEAKEFGKLYGMCVRCGRTLTDEESIEAGIGPICAEKF